MSRLNRVLVVVATVGVLAAVGVLATHTLLASPAPPGRTTPPGPVVLLKSGTSAGVWELTAWKDYAGLSMEMAWQQNRSDTAMGAGGFSDKPFTGHYFTGLGADGNTYTFGPVNNNVERVLITPPGQEPIRAQLAPLPPSLANGQYFFARLPGEVLDFTVEPLDANGDVIEFGDF